MNWKSARNSLVRDNSKCREHKEFKSSKRGNQYEKKTILPFHIQNTLLGKNKIPVVCHRP